MEIELGDSVKDVVSGWSGIATGRYEYLNGCVRIGIAGPDKDGAPEEYVFDIQCVELVEKGAFAKKFEHVREAEPQPVRSVGGPRSHTPPARR